jgi:hypothetical protein
VCLDLRFSNSPRRKRSRDLSNDRVMHFKLSCDRTLHDALTFFRPPLLTNSMTVETVFVYIPPILYDIGAG